MNFPHRSWRIIALIAGVLAMFAGSTVISAASAMAAPPAEDRCSVPYIKVVPKKAGADSNVRIFVVVECPKKTVITMKVNVWKTNGNKDELATNNRTVTAEAPWFETRTLPAPATMGSVCVNTFQGGDKISGMCAPARP